MNAPGFTAVEGSYTRLWAELVPSPERMPALEKIARGLLAHKASYVEVAAHAWGNPAFWYVVALIDQMEGGGGANTFLGNGQSLNRVTTEVPAGEGPFATFLDGALRALRIDGLDKVKSWPAAAVGYYLESYNGWGYLNKPIVSPYIAGWSNKYTKGKYVADHVYDPEAVSGQPGALTILKVLTTLDPTINLGGAAPSKETPVNDLPKLNLDFSTLEPIVEKLVPLIGDVYPPAKPFIPLILMIARTLLHAQPPPAA